MTTASKEQGDLFPFVKYLADLCGRYATDPINEPPRNNPWYCLVYTKLVTALYQDGWTQAFSMQTESNIESVIMGIFGNEARMCFDGAERRFFVSGTQSCLDLAINKHLYSILISWAYYGNP